MQNVMYHAWEMGQESWSQIAQMLLVARKVTIWGVSYEQVVDANNNFELPYTPDQFLELVRQGFISVAARPKWYSGPSERQRLRQEGYLATDWQPGFDDELSRLSSKGKVQLLNAPDTEEYVNFQIENKTQLYMNVSYHIDKRSFPENWYNVTARKLRRATSKSNLVLRALTTSRHHFLAARDLACDSSVETLEHAAFSTDLNAYVTGVHSPSIARQGVTLEEALYYLSRMNFRELSTKASFDRHLRMLDELRSSNIKAALAGASGSSIQIDDDLIAPLEELKNKAAETTSLGRHLQDAGFFAVGAAAALKAGIDFKGEFQRREVLKADLSIVSALASTAAMGMISSGTYRNASHLTPVDAGPVERALLIGLKGPFDGQHPTLKNVEELTYKLEQIARVIHERYRGATYTA